MKDLEKVKTIKCEPITFVSVPLKDYILYTKTDKMIHDLEEYLTEYISSINNPDIYEIGISDTLLEVKMKLDELKEKYK